MSITLALHTGEVSFKAWPRAKNFTCVFETGTVYCNYSKCDSEVTLEFEIHFIDESPSIMYSIKISRGYEFVKCSQGRFRRCVDEKTRNSLREVGRTVWVDMLE